ncbi:MAG: DUF4381 domain-containing protein [Mariprofundaceae bacterium]
MLNPQAAQDPLADLRDIHLPADVSWWPLAPGWWMLMALLLLFCALLVWWWRKPKRISTPSRSTSLQAAKKELAQLAGDWRSGQVERTDLIMALSALLRRVAIKVADEPVAGMSGEAWLEWLDTRWDHQHFVEGEGRAFVEAPYCRKSDIDVDILLPLVKNWIEAQR